MNLIGRRSVVLSKIVGDLLLRGPDHIVDDSISRFKTHFKLGRNVLGLGTVRYFGINIIQRQWCTVPVHGDDKLEVSHFHTRHRNYINPLDQFEHKSFDSINILVNWRVITVFSFCSLFWSIFQPLAPTTTIVEQCKESSRLYKLTPLGTATFLTGPDGSRQASLSVMIFCDPGRTENARQLSHIVRLLLDGIKSGSHIHAVS